MKHLNNLLIIWCVMDKVKILRLTFLWPFPVGRLILISKIASLPHLNMAFRFFGTFSRSLLDFFSANFRGSYFVCWKKKEKVMKKLRFTLSLKYFNPNSLIRGLEIKIHGLCQQGRPGTCKNMWKGQHIVMSWMSCATYKILFFLVKKF